MGKVGPTTMAAMAERQEKQRKRRRRLSKPVIVACVIVAAIGVSFGAYKATEAYFEGMFGGIEYDSAAEEGEWIEVDSAEVIAALNEKVSEGMINISMNTAPQFSNGASAGNLMIVNESVNLYPQKVEIKRNDTGEVIYSSGAIPVGSRIKNAKLDTDLSAGTYACTAYFYNLVPDTGEPLGCAGAEIKITVLS